MGNFSRDTFNKMKHYVGVRLQQSVPLVDADWNEQDDIRKHELQMFLKWFVGNGVPKGNDGFNIFSVNEGINNDFFIKGGDSTVEEAGRCLVEGWEVINEKDLKYTNQLLYDKASLVAEWDVLPLKPLRPPQKGSRTDLVYLDVWEREVNAAEDLDLFNKKIGIETCVRLKREWVVRVIEGKESKPPKMPELPEPPAGHVFYLLAVITRKARKQIIEQNDIEDQRRIGVEVLSEEISVQRRRHYHGIMEVDSSKSNAIYLYFESEPYIPKRVKLYLKGLRSSCPLYVRNLGELCYYSSFTIENDCTLWAWGYNSYGELGLGDNNHRNSPVQVGDATDWVVISAGSYHSLAIKKNGTLWAWGYNSYGELGL